MKVQRVSITHSVQTQHKSNIVLQQAGVWKKTEERSGDKRTFIYEDAFGRMRPNCDTRKLHTGLPDLTCVVQIVFQPALGALVVELPSAGHKEEQVVPEDDTSGFSNSWFLLPETIKAPYQQQSEKWNHTDENLQ